MNIRKSIDYTELYEALDGLMTRQLPQMELYCGIGKAVCRRREKGVAVMASEYLNQHYPDVKGFSPRSLHRMRDFYRIYESHPSLLSRAMKLGWTLNLVIMEADLTMELREWYMKAAEQFEWSKSELIASIAAKLHESTTLSIDEKICSALENDPVLDTSLENKFSRKSTACRLRGSVRGMGMFLENCYTEVYCYLTLRHIAIMRC